MEVLVRRSALAFNLLSGLWGCAPLRSIAEDAVHVRASSIHVHTLHHYMTLHYIPQTHDFAEFYCVFRTFMALLEHNRCGNTKYFDCLVIILYIC